MASDREEMLNGEIEAFEEELKQLAVRLEEISGVDCNFGACVFDPAMNDIEDKIAEVQKRKKILNDVLQSLEACGA
jgi:prefoldin subunit 5